MTILLTGGAGYIGSHTAVLLLERGYDIIIADNFINSSKEAVSRIEQIAGKSLLCADIDMCSPKDVDKLFSDNKIDAVIHFAALKAVGESTVKPIEYYRNNVDATLTMLEAMAKHGVNNIIYSSSATVYGVPDNVPVKESEPAGRCFNPYGRTKYVSELIIQDACAAYSELSAVLLRYFNPIGAHESGLLGDDPDGIPNNLMPYITQVAAGTLPKLSVFGNDYNTKDGTCVRDYIHVVDLAEGHVDALDYAFTHKGAEVINLGTGIGQSVLDIVKAFTEATGVEIPYEITGRRPGDIDEYYADPGKAYRTLGWKAKKNITDMCRDSWNWQKKNPNGMKKA